MSVTTLTVSQHLTFLVTFLKKYSLIQPMAQGSGLCGWGTSIQWTNRPTGKQRWALPVFSQVFFKPREKDLGSLPQQKNPSGLPLSKPFFIMNQIEYLLHLLQGGVILLWRDFKGASLFGWVRDLSFNSCCWKPDSSWPVEIGEDRFLELSFIRGREFHFSTFISLQESLSVWVTRSGFRLGIKVFISVSDLS